MRKITSDDLHKKGIKHYALVYRYCTMHGVVEKIHNVYDTLEGVLGWERKLRKDYHAFDVDIFEFDDEEDDYEGFETKK